MIIFYYIIAHQSPQQLLTLVNALASTNAIICIHIDKKHNIKPFTDIIKETKHIYFIQNRISVYWAGFSQIKCTLIGINESVSKNADTFVLLSGQDFPIKSQKEITQFLTVHSQSNFLTHCSINDCWDGAKTRYNKYYFVDFFSSLRIEYPTLLYIINKAEGLLHKLQFFVNRKVVFNYETFGGSQWMVLNKKATTYIIDFLEKNKEYKSFFKRTTCSDELFFQTLLLNSPLKSSIINNNYRFVLFTENKSNPEILTSNYFKEIVNSDALFARKFDIIIDSQIINQLQQYFESKS